VSDFSIWPTVEKAFAERARVRRVPKPAPPPQRLSDPLMADLIGKSLEECFKREPAAPVQKLPEPNLLADAPSLAPKLGVAVEKDRIRQFGCSQFVSGQVLMAQTPHDADRLIEHFREEIATQIGLRLLQEGAINIERLFHPSMDGDQELRARLTVIMPKVEEPKPE